MKLVSLFSGAGGLDLGFRQAGFRTIWANEFDPSIAPTYRRNAFGTRLDQRSLLDIRSDEIPDCDGIIGGPPCQSWSAAGEQRGLADRRGQLFLEYVRVLRDKQPLFFVAENVPGLLMQKHRPAFLHILELLYGIGYSVKYAQLSADQYGVPQERQRVFLVGFKDQLTSAAFRFPVPTRHRCNLHQAIRDIQHLAVPDGVPRTGQAPPNHEYATGGFSYIYMSRNRVKDWNDVSFTIQASARHAPIHPSAPPMEKVSKDVFRFAPGRESEYRRMSVRECARVQTFPDSFRFLYNSIDDGYKMVGNSVPVELARHVAVSVAEVLA